MSKNACANLQVFPAADSNRDALRKQAIWKRMQQSSVEQGEEKCQPAMAEHKLNKLILIKS